MAILPSHIHCDATACADARNGSFFPIFWECWQHLEGHSGIPFRIEFEVALDQHFDHPSATAEVAVNLERRVGIEKVRVGAAATARVIAVITSGLTKLRSLR